MKDKIKTKRRKSEGMEGTNIQDTPIKPKSFEQAYELENLDFVEERERIAEKLSISVPVQPLQRPTGVMSYVGQRVRLLLRDGTVVLGFLQKRIFNFIHLLNIEETGKDFKVIADWIDIEIGTIARVYPATAQAVPLTRPQG